MTIQVDKDLLVVLETGDVQYHNHKIPIKILIELKKNDAGNNRLLLLSQRLSLSSVSVNVACFAAKEGHMVWPGTRRGDDDFDHVTNRIGRVEGRTVSASSRDLRGRHSTSDIPSIPTPFATGIYYDTCAQGSSTQPSHIPIMSRPPLPSHRPRTLVPYDIYGSSHPSSQPHPCYMIPMYMLLRFILIYPIDPKFRNL
ncbi:hypothetical protein M9H77_21696 [Catharanthus roseus]|uniref:Uncharacterized protein n=1 Tax=Catharanthus roseus TaxID=4058 RepID=A0ACC0AQZ8_CATRO|nr:hypothetical protein M9H77_21696 [Catharanthus roseus]